MFNEFLYLCPTSSALPMGALMCITHLLPLLYPLLFVFNARHKHVTLIWIVIMENNDSSYFSTHQVPLCSYLHLWDKIRTQLFVASCFVFDAFIVSWCLVYCMRCVWSGCSRHVSFSQLSRTFISCFSLFFFSFHFHSLFLFSSWRFVCLESFFFPKFSSFLFRFLVSFLHSLLCISTFMVDYSSVRSDCPSVSFFFARFLVYSWLWVEDVPKLGFL